MTPREAKFYFAYRYLYIPGPLAQGCLFPEGWILPHQSLINNVPQAYLWMDVIFSKVVSLFIVDTSLVQSDKSLTKALIICFPKNKDIYLSSEGFHRCGKLGN